MVQLFSQTNSVDLSAIQGMEAWYNLHQKIIIPIAGFIVPTCSRADDVTSWGLKARAQK